MAVKIYDVRINALCDSGANSTVINEKYLPTFREIGVKLKPSDIQVRTADGAVHTVKGKINIPIEWNNRKENIDVLVNPIRQDMIIGMDLLGSFGLFANRTCDIELSELEDIDYGELDDISGIY